MKGTADVTRQANKWLVSGKCARRSVRRCHRERMIAYALNSLIVQSWPPGQRLSWAVHHHDHLKYCACRMCNRRRVWWGLPRQERRQLQREREHLRGTNLWRQMR